MASGAVKWFAGARKVTSGPYPLYRLLVIAVLVACACQLWLGVPASMAMAAGSVNLDLLFLWFQVTGGLLVFSSFYIDRAVLSLQIERAGCITLATASAMYFAAISIFTITALPVSAPVWMGLFFAFYLLRRVFYEIPHQLEEVREAAKQVLGRG